MTRQDQFKQELMDLLAKYKVEMSVIEKCYGHSGYQAEGINFWSYTQFDADGNVIGDCIDLDI